MHFGAVDQSCRVAVNGIEVGGHVGGYLPFNFDVTDAVREGVNTLTLAVRDVTGTSYLSAGKQSLKRGGIWYTPQSGIWQTVWLEHVPENYVTAIDYLPSLDSVEITISSVEPGTASLRIEASAPLEFEIPTNPDFDGKDIDVDKITPGPIIMMQMMLEVLSGNEDLLKHYKEHNPPSVE